MHYSDLILKKEGGVATLIMNRPEKLNAISTAMSENLPKIIKEVQEDDEMKVLILTGAGRGFCSGFDISIKVTHQPGDEIASRRNFLKPSGIWGVSLAELQKPTIAAINGVAVGGGLSFALMCDLRIASDKAMFGAPWVKRGMIPDVGCTYLLPRIVGADKALELMYIGDIIDAGEAERIGLVTRVTPHDTLMTITYELATKIARGPSVAIELMKRAVHRNMASGIRLQIDFETYAQNLCHETYDYKEGHDSFLEKRLPEFKGK